MSLPKHKNPTRTDRKATAPYNFIPLPERVLTATDDTEKLPDHDTYVTAGYANTGYFVVKLETKSPVYVRCALTRREFELDEEGKDRNGNPVNDQTRIENRIKNTSNFFYTVNQEEPVIPGSSLRGMIRNLLEIVSYGKMRYVTNKNLIYRAVGDMSSLGAWYREQTLGANQTTHPNMKFDYPSPFLKGGYLCHHNGEWAIRPAKQHHNETFIHVEYSAAQSVIGGQNRQIFHQVYVQPGVRAPTNRGRRGPGNLRLNLAVTTSIAPNTTPCPAGMVPAVLVESGHMGKPLGQPPIPHQKHMHCAIYEEDTTATPIEISRETWEAYEEDRNMTRGIRTRKLDKDGQPLFYLLDAHGKLVFFGPTMMFRLQYKNSIHDLIPESLRNLLTVDYADAIFGFVREKTDFQSRQDMPPQGSKKRAYSSRVFVTDASLSGNVAPQDLWYTGNAAQAVIPKILSTPKPTSFQHYLVQPDFERDNLSHYDSPKADATGTLRGYETVIRGYKLYWHQSADPSIEAQQSPPPNSKQHTRFKPVKAGVTFSFRIYFENLSDRELGALCWTLHPLGDATKEYCHSLGMGKALGMGAVKLKALLHLTDRETRYGSLFQGDDWQKGEDSFKDLSDRTTLEQLTQDFETHLLGELKPNRPCAHLSGLERIGMLLKMLEFKVDGWGETVRTDTLGIGDFRQRKVLPDPRTYFSELENLAEPTLNEIPNTAIPAGKNPHPAQGNQSPQTGSTSAAIASQVDSIRRAITSLKGAGQVSSIEGIVGRIVALSDLQPRIECAQELQKWLKANKLWNKEPHKSREWHQRLQQLSEHDV